MEEKQYIGDGVYVSNDGHHVIIEADGMNGKNKIYLELGVYLILRRLCDEFFQLKKAEQSESE